VRLHKRVPNPDKATCLAGLDMAGFAGICKGNDMLGLLIWPFVVMWGALTERFWPDAVKRILIVTAVLFALSVLNLYMMHNRLIDEEERALRMMPVSMLFNFVIKLLSTTIVFMIGFGFGKWKRRAK
jgi:hypothetical protein